MGRGRLCFLRVPVSQNDCLMEVMLSLFRVHRVSVIALSCPHVNNQFRTLLQDTRILTMFLLSDIEQHVRPLKNDYFKPCHVYFILPNKSKNVLQSEIKDLILEVSNLSITFFFSYFLWGTKHLWQRRWGGLNFFCMFTGSFAFKQQTKLFIFCKCRWVHE